jgi:predicted CoA-substrate-specific enzyme activase
MDSLTKLKMERNLLMIHMGIDIGSVCAKGVAIRGERIEKILLPTGWNIRDTAHQVRTTLLSKLDAMEDDIAAVVATGYGRVSIPYASKKVTEITCHARGAAFLSSDARTIIDIGGQDSKVISIDENGRVLDFVMNDKCAAGTGRFLQVMAHVLETEVDDLDEMAREGSPVTINAMCTVFAESEIISLLAQGTDKASIASGILSSISQRVQHLSSRIVLRDQIIFTGGVSRSKVLRHLLSEKLGMVVCHHEDAQFAGALGAALIAKESH